MSRKSPTAAQRRSAARLAAVQALYQVELSGATPDGILIDFLRDRIGETRGAEAADAEPMIEPDGALFGEVVRGTLADKALLDEMIGNALNDGWTVDRLEAILRAILRAGAYELRHRSDVPPKVAITEYVDVAHAFYSGPEPGLINAVLDRIARVLRPDEMGRGSNAPA